MLRENDQIRAYYSAVGKMFAPSIVEKSLEYAFDGYIDDGTGLEPPYQFIYFGDVKNIYRNSPSIVKTKKLKFHPDDEKEVFKQLLIKPDEVLWTKEKIRELILETDPKKVQENIQTILKIDKLNIIEDFDSELTFLKNENCYVIATMISDYIQARLEELREGGSEKELKGVDEIEEIAKEEPKEEKKVEEEKKEVVKQVNKTTTPKRGRPAKKTTKK